MPRFQKAPARADHKPSFLTIAKSLYGEAFGSHARADVADAMADWAELHPDEQSFAAAHLQYLNLVAQAATQRLLTEMRDLLEDLVDAMEADEEAPDVPDPQPQPQAVMPPAPLPVAPLVDEPGDSLLSAATALEGGEE